jgi:glutathione peroxidase
VKSIFNPLITLFGIALISLSGAASAACPDYMKGEYRKLHSKDSVNICELMENKTVLVVNTASHCGFTSQFKELEALHKKYKDKGLVIVGFASDDFKQEDADEEKAAEICYLNYGVTFTMLSPTHVTGKEANPLFKALAEQAQEPKWNFNKYLVGKDGQLVEYFGSLTKPDSPKLAAAIEGLL